MPSRYLDAEQVKRLAEHRYDLSRKSLAGRVVLVPGGAGGLGGAITALLLQDGALPVVAYRSQRGHALDGTAHGFGAVVRHLHRVLCLLRQLLGARSHLLQRLRRRGDGVGDCGNLTRLAFRGLVHLQRHLLRFAGGARGMLWRNHSHLLDMMNMFAGADPDWVISELEPGFENYGVEYAGDGGRDPNTEPGVNAYIAYKNGVRAFLTGYKQSVGEFYMDLIGETGRIHVSDTAVYRYIPGENGLASSVISPRATIAGMQAGIAELISCYETGATPSCTPRDARKAVSLIDAILRSQAAGNTPVKTR